VKLLLLENSTQTYTNYIPLFISKNGANQQKKT